MEKTTRFFKPNELSTKPRFFIHHGHDCPCWPFSAVQSEMTMLDKMVASFTTFLRAKIMQIGYVRVSTNDQNTALQRNALECAGCELIFEDKMSGKTSDRPGLKKVLRTLSEGDTLVVWKLDRLGRSMRHLVTLIEDLRGRGVNFRSLTDSIDTSTPMGRFFFHIIGCSGRNGARADRRANPCRAGCSAFARADWWPTAKAIRG